MNKLIVAVGCVIVGGGLALSFGGGSEIVFDDDLTLALASRDTGAPLVDSIDRVEVFFSPDRKWIYPLDKLPERERVVVISDSEGIKEMLSALWSGKGQEAPVALAERGMLHLIIQMRDTTKSACIGISLNPPRNQYWVIPSNRDTAMAPAYALVKYLVESHPKLGALLERGN